MRAAYVVVVVGATALILYVSAAYYGPSNLLWFSNLSAVLLAASLVTRHPLPASAAAVGVLVLESVWTLDLLLRLLLGRPTMGLTEYVFVADFFPDLGERPLWVRGVALYHVALVPGLWLTVRRLGYDRRGLRAWMVLAGVVGIACLLATPAARNVNMVRGFGLFQPSWMTLPGYVVAWFLVQLAFFWWPTHLLLARRDRHPEAAASSDRGSPSLPSEPVSTTPDP